MLGFDAVIEAAETPTGDGLLDLVDRWGSVPISPAWLGDAVVHASGVEWRRVSLTHLAIAQRVSCRGMLCGECHERGRRRVKPV